MTLQSSGTISYSNIRDEFGEPNGKNIGAYRKLTSVGALSNLPLDTGIPTSGEIKFSDFYGKKLNIVVDFHSGGTVTRQNAQDRYNGNNVTVVGGFRSKPTINSTSWQGGKKIIIHVNKIIGSTVNNSDATKCALITGSWRADTELIIDVGSNGQIWGAGGKGGDGGNYQNSGETGKTGTSALGITYTGGTTVNVTNSGAAKIHRGFGGGGGGGGGHQADKGSRRYASGGGGGGGQGYPGGPRGDRGNGGSVGGNGTAGNINAAGNGGSGSNNGNEAEGGGGGEGGWTGDASADRGGNGEDGAGANGGGNGAAIRRGSGVTLGSITINGNGRIDGATNATGVS